jgi:hypothetical protein
MDGTLNVLWSLCLSLTSVYEMPETRAVVDGPAETPRLFTTVNAWAVTLSKIPHGIIEAREYGFPRSFCRQVP